jgi:hypothetical protein
MAHLTTRHDEFTGRGLHGAGGGVGRVDAGAQPFELVVVDAQELRVEAFFPTDEITRERWTALASRSGSEELGERGL